MQASEHSDRLVDVLLCELLGGEAPPDLVASVLAKAFPKRRRLLRPVCAILALAAGIAAAVTVWVLLPARYPGPGASGSYEIADGGPLRRGATVRTGADSAALTLGGYCHIDIDPHSSLRIEGAEEAEEVFLEQGGIVCEVDRAAGGFAVRTEVGRASVAGTRFSVQVVLEKGEDEMVCKRMLVQVLAGVVVVSGAWGEVELARGEEKLLPAPKARPKTTRIPKTMVTLSHVDDSAEGRRSLSASGHACGFERPEQHRFVEAVLIFGSRYGHAKPPKENFHVYVLDGKQQTLADVPVPYATVERGDMRWFTLRTPSIEVTERFLVALAFNPGRTKGVFLGQDQSVEQSHSFTGMPETGLRRVTEPYDWMIRVVLSKEPTGKRGIRRLADRKPVKKGDPFEGCIEVKYDTGKSDGRRSMGGAGPALRIKVSDFVPKAEKAQTIKLHGFRVYASRYGAGYDLDETMIDAAVLHADGTVLWKGQFPYGRFGYRAKWISLALDKPADLGKLTGATLTLALDPHAQRTKGVYFHYSKDPKESHSATGSVGRGFRDAPDVEWLIRAYLKVEPATDF